MKFFLTYICVGCQTSNGSPHSYSGYFAGIRRIRLGKRDRISAATTEAIFLPLLNCPLPGPLPNWSLQVPHNLPLNYPHHQSTWSSRLTKSHCSIWKSQAICAGRLKKVQLSLHQFKASNVGLQDPWIGLDCQIANLWKITWE